MAALDIEDSAALIDWLSSHGHIGADEKPRCTVLAGGVSNRTVLVERSDGTAWVLKQALALCETPLPSRRAGRQTGFKPSHDPVSH